MASPTKREPSPKRISHALTFPLTIYNRATPSLSSKFSLLKEKILSTPSDETPKRTNSIRSTARRLSGSRKRTSSLGSIPGRRKEVGYAERSSDSEVFLDDKGPDDEVKPATDALESLYPEYDTTAQLPYQVPEGLIQGLHMMRVTHKKRVLRMFRINPQTFELSWDSKSSSRCSIDSIEDIREGEEARYYRETLKVSNALAPRWATILYNDQRHSRNRRRQLHVVAQSLEDFRLFSSTLKRLALYRQAICRIPGLPQDALLEDWTKYAAPSPTVKEECVTIEDVQAILKKFYIYCSQAYLRKKFAEVDPDINGQLTFSKFEKLVQMLKVRPEIQSIFTTIADMTFPRSETRGISKEALLKFGTESQKIHLSDKILDHMFERFSLEEDGISGVTVEGFSELLMSESCMPLVSPPQDDLKRPLTDYFISSSHNTYLVGRQVAGVSSIEPYIQVLEEGCRCIEIDVWDGDHEPVVNHGRTFSTSVSFSSVIDAIDRYGFRASPLPLILSLEVHCNIENQNKMVDIMKEQFGDKLVTEPLALGVAVLPSPADLEHRIVVKVKCGTVKPNDTKTFSNGSDGGNSGPTAYSSTTDSSFSELEENGPKTLADQVVKPNRADATKRAISAKLGNLGVYAQGIKFRNFSLPNSKTVNHVFSFSEDKINALIKDESAEQQLIKHNKKYLLRTYPSGYRLSSSNYDPIPYWKRGAQMVSLNWQTYGELIVSDCFMTFAWILC